MHYYMLQTELAVPITCHKRPAIAVPSKLGRIFPCTKKLGRVYRGAPNARPNFGRHAKIHANICKGRHARLKNSAGNLGGRSIKGPPPAGGLPAEEFT